MDKIVGQLCSYCGTPYIQGPRGVYCRPCYIKWKEGQSGQKSQAQDPENKIKAWAVKVANEINGLKQENKELRDDIIKLIQKVSGLEYFKEIWAMDHPEAANLHADNLKLDNPPDLPKEEREKGTLNL